MTSDAVALVPSSARRLRGVLAVVFFFSGAAALLFETLWFRLAGLTFGNTAWASAIVLASFMSGLALGNLLAPRLSRTRDPLRVYAMLEAAIGVCGVLLVFVLPASAPRLAPLFRQLLESAWALNSARLALAFIFLVIPATLMGATLPTVIRTLSSTDANFGRTLGVLYGWNTMGAMIGALAGEAFLIEAIGIRGTSLVAAAMNLMAGSAAWILSGRGAGEDVRPAPEQRRARTLRLLLAAGGCGFALLALEVLWFRFVAQFVVTTSLAFAVMLAVVLLGIGGGALIGAAASRRWPNLEQWTMLIAATSGLAVVLGYWGFQPVPVMSLESPLPDEWVRVAGDSLQLMLLVSALSGLLFTMVGKLVQREVGDETRATSLLTFANTIGATAGSLIAGFVFIPSLGVERSFFIIACLYGCIALLTMERFTARAIIPVVAVLGAALLFFPFGLMRDTFIPMASRTFLERGGRIVAVREGLIETIAYVQNDFGREPYVHRLVTNGHSMSATTFSGRRYMSLFVHLPLALRPQAKNALLISFGVGVTARALADAKQLASIDVVDISRDVLELSDIVWPGTSNALRDPRVNVHIEDGRFFLLTTDKRFDLITAEPPPPKNAGVVSLYTLEYFRLLRDRLTANGIASYWLPAYQLTSADSKALIGAFCGAFADCSLWSGAGAEWILVGSRGRSGAPNAVDFSRQWSDPVAGQSLRRIGVEVPEQLPATFLADAAALRSFVGDVPPITDDFPLRLSSRLPRALPHIEFLMSDQAQAYRRSRWLREVIPAPIHERGFAYIPLQRMIDRSIPDSSVFYEPEVIFRILTRTDLRTLPRVLLRSNAWLEGIADREIARGGRHPAVTHVAAIGALSDRDFPRARELFAGAARGGVARAVEGEILAAHLAGDPAYAQQRIAASRQPVERWAFLQRP